MYTVVVDQNALHFEISLLTILLVLEFDEGVLEAVLRSLVPNDFTGYYLAKPTEYQIEIFVYFQLALQSLTSGPCQQQTFCDRIQLAYEENVFWGFNLSIR